MISLQNPTPDLQAQSSILPSPRLVRLHKNDDFEICNLGASSIIISFSSISDCILLSLLHFDDFCHCTAAHLLSSWDGYNSIHSMVALGVGEYVTSAPRAIRENKMKKKTHVLLPQHDITKSVLLRFATDYTHSDVYSKDVTTSSSRQTVSSLPAHAVRDNVITSHHTSHCALPCCLAS